MRLRDRLIARRPVLAAAGTLAAALVAGKPRAATLDDLAGALEKIDPPRPPPAFSFTGADGQTHTLAEFKGHGMVVNMWATWCGPCVAELPSLAAASRALAPSDIAVLPLSSDRGGAAAVRAFFDSHGITGLPVLLDPHGAAAEAWQARGIPTSIIIDRQGRAVARVEGAADWSSPASIALIKRLAGAS
ncbi:MAG: TlpA family protein disulfide reductase [Proteobacteria bacterium]|nr:TlpA family protein disulfide reductase [Pseudomonadota bacterium]